MTSASQHIVHSECMLYLSPLLLIGHVYLDQALFGALILWYVCGAARTQILKIMSQAPNNLLSNFKIMAFFFFNNAFGIPFICRFSFQALCLHLCYIYNFSSTVKMARSLV